MNYSRKFIFSIFALSLLGSISLVYAIEGTFITSFDGTDGAGTAFEAPQGVATDNNDRIIVTDTTLNLVQIYDSTGTFVTSFNGSDGSGLAFVDPQRVATDTNDRIIVTDLALNLVQIYDSTGSFVTSFNGSDGAGTTFVSPVGVATDTNNRIIVTDLSFFLVQIYDSTGTFVTSIDGSDGAGTAFTNPIGVATDTNNRIIVLDPNLDLVQIYDSTGTFVAAFDGSDGAGLAFDVPHGVATDSNDRIIVTDTALDLVQIYTSAGTFVAAFDGTGGGGAVFDIPRGVATDTNDRIIVSDTGLDLVQIYDDVVSSSSDVNDGNGGGSNDAHKTRPTFGLSHSTYAQLVDGGFSFNGKSFDISDNFWTPFEIQKVNVGDTNSFTAKVYADKGLRVQEFLFGIPEVGDAHKAELGIEVIYDFDGVIEQVNAVQKTAVIDVDSLVVMHSKSKCTPSDEQKNCDTTHISMRFLEPLKYNVMAIKAIDFKNRVQLTSLNDGFDVTGDSLNPMNTKVINANQKNVGLVKVTQTSKYSNIWATSDGLEFEMNIFGSFKRINESFERPTDTGVPKNRFHSEFYTLKQSQVDLAYTMMDSYYRTSMNYDKTFSEINNVFSYEYPETFDSKLDDPEIIKTMMLQEQKAQKVMDYLIDPASKYE